MEEIYRKTRLFWHNLKRIDTPKIKTFGIDKIIIAGLEFNMFDSLGHPINLFVAANSLNESGFYYEKNNSDKMGFLLGKNDSNFNSIISNLLNEAADLTYNMEEYKTLSRPPKLNFVNFFALGRGGRFYKFLTYNEIFCPEHPYHNFFIYAKQLINEIRKLEYYRLMDERKKNKRESKNKKSSFNTSKARK